MNIDDYQNMIDRTTEVVREIIQDETDAWYAPEMERMMVEQYLGASEEERAVFPRDFVDRVTKVIDKLEQKYGR